MLFPQAHYEIEFRCHFGSDDEAYQILPFLQASFKHEYTWVDNYYGLEIYRRGEVLREGFVRGASGIRYHLGWKSPDIGSFANIRREIDEYFKEGQTESAILRHFTKEERLYAQHDLAPALEKAGYHQFLSYSGHSFTGRDDRLGVNTKIMHCPLLRYPLLVELEKLAETEAEARECENQLMEICRELRLEKYTVHEEPGTLAYQALFGQR